MIGQKIMVSNFAALGVLYLALSPRVCTPLYGAMLFHPDKYPSGNYQIEVVDHVMRKEVFFPALNGKKLHGWLFSKPGTKHVILFHHGNAGNLTYRLALVGLLMQAGSSVFLYDYQGYGLSEGSVSLQGICDDGLAAYDFLVKDEGYAPQQIILYGESLGAGVACQIAAKRPSAGLILQSGFASLQRISKEVLPFVRIYPSFLFPRPELDNLQVLSQEHPPLLILHGRLDTLVPFSHAQELYELAKDPKQLVQLPNAGHNDISGMEPQLYLEAVRGFLASLS